MIYHISIFRTHNLTISCSKTLVFYSLLSIIQCGLLNTDDINDNFSISWINYIVVLGGGHNTIFFSFFSAICIDLSSRFQPRLSLAPALPPGLPSSCLRFVTATPIICSITPRYTFNLSAPLTTAEPTPPTPHGLPATIPHSISSTPTYLATISTTLFPCFYPVHIQSLACLHHGHLMPLFCHGNVYHAFPPLTPRKHFAKYNIKEVNRVTL